MKIFAFIILNLTILGCQNSKYSAEEETIATPRLKSQQHNAIKINDSTITSKQPRNSNYNKQHEEIEPDEKGNWLQEQNSETNTLMQSRLCKIKRSTLRNCGISFLPMGA